MAEKSTAVGRQRDAPLMSPQEFLEMEYHNALRRYPQLDMEQAHYLECARLHISALIYQQEIFHVRNQILKLRHEHDSIDQRRRHTHHFHPPSDESNSDRRKRVRRTANQIARHYECKVQRCHKSYGSQGSLNQHIKLKHPELFHEYESLPSL